MATPAPALAPPTQALTPFEKFSLITTAALCVLLLFAAWLSYRN